MPIPVTFSPEWTAYISRLTDAAVSIDVKKAIALELRDWTEQHRDPAEVARYLGIELPIIIQTLRDGEPATRRDAPEQIMRVTLLSIIERLPHSEHLKQYVVEIQNLMMHLLRKDNEDLGATCVKIVINFNRTYRSILEPHNMPFVQWMVELYGNMAEVVQRTFSDEAPGPSLSPSTSFPGLNAGEGENQQAHSALLHTFQSFKVLVECPIATVLFTTGPEQSVAEYSKLLVPASIKLLELQVEQQRRAHEESAKSDSLWIGVAPEIKNRAAYTEFIGCQTKVMSYIAVVFRQPHEQFRSYAELIPGITVRLLQDCPAEASATRKDLLIAMRHILHDDIRPLFFHKLDALLDERVLMGNGVASLEGLRTLAYSTLADLIHHSRESLSPEQLARVIHAYSCNVHMMSLPCSTQTLSMKLLLNLIDQVTARCSRTEAARVLMGLLESSIDKLGVLYRVYEDLIKQTESATTKSPENDVFQSFCTVERVKPVENIAYVVENPETVLRDARQLYYTLLHVFKAVLTGLQKVEAPPPDAEVMGPFFENGIKCLALYEKWHIPPGEKDVMEKLGDVFVALHPHVFQELWTVKFPFVMEQVMVHQTLLGVPQSLLAKEPVSKQLVSIMLKHLVGDLESLGNQDTRHAAATLRMFKMCFMAASLMPELNEMALVPHIPRLMVDSFPLAAKSAEPTHYYLLLRALFRAIGGHKFDTMYAIVTPLLEELLQTLNRLLISAPPNMRDLIAELCLTVPVRLTHLLPYLGYLMKPLVYALRANPELVAQGLRTLELCVDNLTPEFLDPTLSPVLRDLMGALHDILKPLPHPHMSAHTTIRILGKLGGRNRRLQHEPPQLAFLSGSHEAQVLLSFDGRNEEVDIGPICRLAAKSVRHPHASYRSQSYEVLKSAMSILVHKGLADGQSEDVFQIVDEGLFSAIHTTEHGAHAQEFLRDVTKHIFTCEGNATISELTKRTNFATIILLHVKTLTESLAIVDTKDLEKAKELVTLIIRDGIAAYRDPAMSDPVRREMASILHLVLTGFLGLCWEDTTVKKMAGYYGISLFVDHIDVAKQWVQERQHDFVKGLLAILKDTPPDTVKNIDDVAATLMNVLRTVFTQPAVVPGTEGEEKKPTPTHASPQNVGFALQMFITELTGPNALLRSTSQAGIALLAELTNQSVVDLLMPARDRVVNGIYAKPLRALPLHKQIGNIETVTYALSLRPPLLAVNDELWRMLSEALAVAESPDEGLYPSSAPRGFAPQRRTMDNVTKLRVSCLKLLTAAIHLTEFYAGQPTMRQKLTAVYFKSLYWNTDDVKDAASEGLRTALQHQARLPKDLLHSGLMPILTNLSDSKRLTLPNLDGLGRLMDLLTSHFKVEIGTKLIDHHRQLADEKMLKEAASGPLADNEEIQKIAHLVDIFHRLPHPGAHVFLKDLTNNVVESEAIMYSTTKTPFTAPLAAFFNKYPVEAVDYLFEHIGSPRHVRTIRTVLVSQLAPIFNEAFLNQLPRLISTCFETKERFLPGLSICLDLARLDPEAFAQRDELIQSLLTVWGTEFSQEADVGYHLPMAQTRIATLLIAIFRICLEKTLRLDILFSLIAIFTQRVALDLSGLARFLHNHVVAHAPLETKRAIFKKFLALFDEPVPPKERITQFLRIIINPMIIVTYSATPEPDAMDTSEKLVDSEIVDTLHRKVWTVMAQNGFPAKEPSDALTIELIHMTGLMIQNCPELIHESRKDVMKSAWASVSSDDAVVKQASNLLIARFFKAFDSPSKLILKVWVGLLRPYTGNEGRHLIRQATETLAPALPIRIKEETSPPSWVKVTKRFLLEEAGGLSPTILIYRVIIRHADLFFPYRDQFAPHMVNSLSKIQSNPSPETRSMTLDILEHILRWEKQRIQEAKDAASGDAMDTSQNAAATQWMMPVHLRDTCVQFLVRLVLQADGMKSQMVPKALRLLHDMLNLPSWSDISVRPAIFDRMLSTPSPTDDSLPHAASALKLLYVSVEEKPAEWFLENLASLKGWLDRPYNANDPTFDELMIPIINRILSSLPPPVSEEEVPTPAQEFYAFANTIVNEGIRSNTHIPLTLAVLQTLVKKTPASLEEFVPNLLKIFAKLCRDHLAPPPPQPQQQPPGQPRQPNEPATRLLKTVLDIWRLQVPTSSDSRRVLLQGLMTLAEKTIDVSICRIILDMAREWVFVRNDGLPVMREKATLLSKLVCLEFKRFDDPIFTDFLTLILDIYKEPSLRRTDLTIRLESAFLVGCRSKDPVMRLKFIELFDDSLPRALTSRLQWVLGSQTWEYLSEHYWIPQALELLLGSVTDDAVLVPAIQDVDMSSTSVSARFGTRPVTVSQLLRPLKQLLHLDADTTHQMWVITFTALWRALSRKEQTDTHKSLVLLLSKDYHTRQLPLRRNVIQSLLAGVLGCQPPLALPPFVIKYLGKTFNAWHIVLELLQNSLEHLRDEETIRDAALDALAELYTELSEDDMFYGLWRRRGLYMETSVAVSYEQCGLWQDAQLMYEHAQLKARSGGAPFNEQEYCLWEDHWILTAQKLQQWDTLTELASSEGHHDLLLECAWRLSDWEKDRETIEHSILSIAEVATPRRRVFEAYTCLIRGNPMSDRPDFTRLLEDAMQLSLRKWVALPPAVSTVHVPLLQHFQQLVELQEAAQIFHALATTNSVNLEKRSSELKIVLQAWRERLPNLWDDISVWSDLVSWRQHVFQAINKRFLPLIQQPNGTTSNQSSTAGYRGYHEIAWIINRFAHVARKHHLLEVCHNSLARIYTLPNIEISEAFLKLREQARCHYQVPSELSAGLEVINNTNLMYFSVPQKAEFFTLKGMFIAKLGHNDEANAAFGQAVQMDLNMPKAWAEWGRYNDRTFKDNPNDMVVASNAVSCYLQAAGLYKNAKTRPLLIRILWFLSMDDPVATISKAFENFKGDSAQWYWITLVPQLLKTLGHRAARHARRLLVDIARIYPQSLFFELRTAREEYHVLRKQSGQPLPGERPSQGGQSDQQTVPGVGPQTTPNPMHPSAQGDGSHTDPSVQRATAQPWEFVDEITNALKTHAPLLSPTLELIAEHVLSRFKPTPEEEIYRFILALLAEGLHHFVNRSGAPSDDGSVPEACIQNVVRLANGLPMPSRATFEHELVASKPTMKEYVERLVQWRDRYEHLLALRPKIQPLDILSHWLAEFQHHTYEDVEVPGQYLEHKDNSQHFVKIARLGSTFSICRGNSYYFRRLTFMGHDGTKHSFAAQHPSLRTSRREERFMQLFRIFNTSLARRKESRKRNLMFHLPHAVPLSSAVRLLENDDTYVTMQDIYEQQCAAVGFSREEPIIQWCQKIRQMVARQPVTRTEYLNLKLELVDEIVAKQVPRTTITKFFSRTMAGPMELWLMRKQFTLQVAAMSFMTWVLFAGSRQPARISISKSTGMIYASEVIPGFNMQQPQISMNEAVPFRLTPNMQEFITENGMLGLLSTGINAIARCLTEPEYDLEQQLGLFLREEVLAWYQMHQRPPHADILLRTQVQQNVMNIVQRAEVMACKMEREQAHKASTISATRAVEDLISQATNSQNLAAMPEQWLPYL